MQATVEYALKHPELKDDFTNYLAREISQLKGGPAKRPATG